ncbi:MAG: hypothetical protein ACYTBW_00865 [Planctomycetota bacterium]|jgi:hypothetical protein
MDSIEREPMFKFKKSKDEILMILLFILSFLIWASSWSYLVYSIIKDPMVLVLVSAVLFIVHYDIQKFETDKNKMKKGLLQKFL